MLSNPYRVFLHQVLEAFFQIKKKKKWTDEQGEEA